MNRWIAIVALSAMGCGKSTSSPSSTSARGEGEVEPESVVPPIDAREAAQWAAAAQGDPEELMRVADLAGCDGLRERAAVPELRSTAIRAMQYCTDYAQLPWLTEVAAETNDVEARVALEVIDELAARPRRATDPEDADDLHAGCASLLALARSTSRPKERRVLAIRALRMLSERGCVRRADIPTDFDVK